MNVLFLTLMRFSSFSHEGIYQDLVNEFANQGHEVYVVTSCEHKDKSNFVPIYEHGRLHIISAMIPDYYGVGHIKKGLSSIMIGGLYYKAIDTCISEIEFDLILYSTPPVTFCSLIEKLKARYKKSYTYLLLKDIWPQGLIDIGVLSNSGLKGLITNYYERQEHRLYKISDWIGCMSDNNRDYLINKRGIEDKKVEICPNSIKINEFKSINKSETRLKYALPLDKKIFVYGGNLGVAQGIDYLISCLELIEQDRDSFILIIGSGTEYKKINDWIDHNSPQNCRLISALPKAEYMSVLSACDVGLLFLDYRFTIPNFPSRLLSYMEKKMPVIAATDTCSDVGEVIKNGNFGWWCESRKPSEFLNCIKEAVNSDLDILGENSYQYLKDHYDVRDSVKTIAGHAKSAEM